MVERHFQIEHQDILNEGLRHATEDKEHAREHIAHALEIGAQLDGQEEDNGRTALHIAVQEQNIEAVIALLEAGARTDIEDNKGCTPLHYASGLFVKVLLAAGADPLHPDHAYHSALYTEDTLAPFNGHNAEAREINLKKDIALGHAPRPTQKELAVLGIVVDFSSRELLFTKRLLNAAEKNNPYEAQIALENGANVNARTPHAQVTALHMFTAKKNYHGMKLVLEAGANVNVQNTIQQTPLHIVAILGDMLATKLLTAAGAGFSRKNDIEEKIDRTDFTLVDAKGNTASALAYDNGFEMLASYMDEIEHHRKSAPIGRLLVDEDHPDTGINLDGNKRKAALRRLELQAKAAEPKKIPQGPFGVFDLTNYATRDAQQGPKR